MRGLQLAALLIGACGACVACLPAHAGDAYRWVDAQGRVHYADRPGEGDVRQLRKVASVRESVVKLRIQRDDARYLVWADNALAGPVEVMLHLRSGSNVRGEPALPARATVPALGSVLVAYLHPVDRKRGSQFDLALEMVPGQPGGNPDNAQYLFPLKTGAVQVEQGYGGEYSHNDAQNRYAVDFAAPIGTQVLAARDGVVMQIESDYGAAGLDQEQYAGRANFIRIVHNDGSMAVYAHLAENGVQVRNAQRVRAGQVIGISGNTGFSSGPHLHFAVQVNRGMRLESIPFRMFTPRGILRLDEIKSAPPGPAAARHRL